LLRTTLSVCIPARSASLMMYWPTAEFAPVCAIQSPSEAARTDGGAGAR
jgi:hypothetical protein